MALGRLIKLSASQFYSNNSTCLRENTSYICQVVSNVYSRVMLRTVTFNEG